ncbi:MAG TPA: hypothetical protein VFM54_08465 [Micromonosporaceae bacterium]|nr:hypothetical protein [Micromonosporaceae bacterium]
MVGRATSAVRPEPTPVPVDGARGDVDPRVAAYAARQLGERLPGDTPQVLVVGPEPAVRAELLGAGGRVLARSAASANPALAAEAAGLRRGPPVPPRARRSWAGW